MSRLEPRPPPTGQMALRNKNLAPPTAPTPGARWTGGGSWRLCAAGPARRSRPSSAPGRSSRPARPAPFLWPVSPRCPWWPAWARRRSGPEPEPVPSRSTTWDRLSKSTWGDRRWMTSLTGSGLVSRATRPVRMLCSWRSTRFSRLALSLEMSRRPEIWEKCRAAPVCARAPWARGTRRVAYGHVFQVDVAVQQGNQGDLDAEATQAYDRELGVGAHHLDPGHAHGGGQGGGDADGPLQGQAQGGQVFVKLLGEVGPQENRRGCSSPPGRPPARPGPGRPPAATDI